MVTHPRSLGLEAALESSHLNGHCAPQSLPTSKCLGLEGNPWLGGVFFLTSRTFSMS